MDSVSLSISVSTNVGLRKSNSPLPSTKFNQFFNKQLGYTSKGSTAGSIDAVWFKTYELAGAGTQDIALTATSNPIDGTSGSDLDTLTLCMIYLDVNADGTAESSGVSIIGKPMDTANLFCTDPAEGIVVKKQGFVAWGSETGFAISGAGDSLRITNLDATNKATVTILLAGRST